VSQPIGLDLRLNARGQPKGGMGMPQTSRVGRLSPMSDLQARAVPALLVEARPEILAAVKRNRGRRVRVFGSLARGDDRSDSDVDFLVDFDAGSSLFDLLHLTRDLEELLGRSVDVVSAGGLKGRDQEILDEAIDL
jgi:predicted nucleotidyltransferase